MTTSLIDPWHLAFVLDEVLRANALFSLPAFAEHDRAGTSAMIETAARLAEDVFLPSYRLLDDNEPTIENGRVVLPAEIEHALTAFREAGFAAMAARQEDGGLGLPRTFANAAFLQFQAANISIANYAMLTMSAAELLARHGTDEQKARYMAPMLEGRFHGTMALSEPQAGSSLGDITTVARARPDGTYALRGTKMWISGAEHNMGDNIVHLMLARIEGEAPGVKGISLFIVPRKRLDADGRPAIWNNVALAGLNHKMGQRGTVNTVLNVGEGGETIGEIIGAPCQGLACMFTMMNEARIGVAMGAVAHASAGYRLSLAYARDRRQGRHPNAKDPSSPQVPLVEHADVRRMLLQQKAACEGGVALALYLAQIADLKAAAPTDSERRDSALLLDFLTPVFKAWISEECLAANYNAMQVLGGAGYTRDFPLEQHYRDNRLNPIHEGTNGIQAIDLAGRKAIIAEGRALELYLARVTDTAAAAAGDATLQPLADQLVRLLTSVTKASRRISALTASSGQRAALARAPDFMELVGATTFLWIWVEQARVAQLGGDPADISPDEHRRREGLILTARDVCARCAPRAEAAAKRISAGDPAYLEITDEMFG
ncbi:MAG: acyl-CoA dehydrogenase [Hyphomicrobiaceae bacterium]